MGNLTLNLLNSTVCSKVLRCLLLLATVLISTRIISASEVRIVESAGIYYELTDGAFSSAQQKFAGTAKVVCPQNDPSLTYNITTAIIPQFVTDPAGAKYLVTDISEAAFYNCVSLKTVSIPANVTQIEYNAFLYCRNIVTFRIERSTTPLIIGKQIFDGQRLDKHDSYAPLNFYIGRPLSVSGDASLLCQTNTVKCEIEGVTHLTSEYITGCRSLKELTLYTGLESVDNISGCASLTYLEIPEGVVRLGTQAPDGGLQLSLIHI